MLRPTIADPSPRTSGVSFFSLKIECPGRLGEMRMQVCVFLYVLLDMYAAQNLPLWAWESVQDCGLVFTSAYCSPAACHWLLRQCVRLYAAVVVRKASG